MSKLNKLIMMANQVADAKEYPPYLCFEALEDDFQASFSGVNCEYSLDREVWVMLTKSEYTPKINAGDKIYFKNSSPVQSSSTSGVGIFSATKLFNIYGRATSMIYGDDFVNIQSVDKEYILANMFAGNKCVCNVDGEFFNIGISNASRTFHDCFARSNIIKTEIPYFESTKGYAFTGIFSNSTLTEITISDDYLALNADFQSAFNACNISRLMIPKIKSGVYTCNAIAKNCKNLNTVIIKGGVYSTGCFYNAFEGCSSLTKIISLYTSKFLVKSVCSNWLNGINEQGVIIFNKNIEWNPKDIINGNTDDNGEIITWGIPAGWEVKYCDPDNIDDVRDSKDDFLP